VSPQYTQTSFLWSSIPHTSDCIDVWGNSSRNPRSRSGHGDDEISTSPGIEPRFSDLVARSLVGILNSGEIHWYFKVGLNMVVKKMNSCLPPGIEPLFSNHSLVTVVNE
jgi:hypothetical protein